MPQPKCPNCGQITLRTEDWACQWCGYPLPSGPFRSVGKSYRQLKEERLGGPEPEPIVEGKAAAEPDAEAGVVEPEPAPRPEKETKKKAKARSAPAKRVAPPPPPVPEVVSESELAPEPGVEVSPEQEGNTAPLQPDMKLVVEELVSAYEEEGMAANARFGGKVLKITGLVDRVEVKDDYNIYYVNLIDTERQFLQGVRCVFSREHSGELSQLTRGEMVTVVGRYDGSIMDIRLVDCALVG